MGSGEDQTRVYRGGVAPPLLRVVEGFSQGSVLVLHRGVYTLGREEDCDLVLPDPRVSRKHARVERDAAGTRLVDLNSTNGTFVNGQRVQRHQLRNGDRIGLGGVVLEYVEAP